MHLELFGILVIAAYIGYLAYRSGKRNGSRAAYRVGWRRGRRSRNRRRD